NARPTRTLKRIVGVARGDLTSTEWISHSVMLPTRVAEKQAAAATGVIEQRGFPRPGIRVEASENGSHIGPGSGIVLCAESSGEARLGGDSLGERGRPAETVGEEAARKRVEEMSPGAFLDRHMGDMIV